MAHPDPNLQIVTVFESSDPVAFNLAKSALDEAGIEYATVEDALTGYGFSPIINPVSRIEVLESSAGKARETLRSVSGPEDARHDGVVPPEE